MIDTNWYTDTITVNPRATEFTISTAAELAGLAQIVNGGAEGIERDFFSGKTVTLTADIDLLPQHDNWEPIGGFYYGKSEEDAEKHTLFGGTFDGGGHIISHLRINRPDQGFQGLFGCIVGGTVKNLGIEYFYIHGGSDVGAVAGQIERGSLITNCHTAKGIIRGHSDIGGIVGFVYGGHITKCYSACDIYHRGCNGAGGIAGSLNGSSIFECEDCYHVCGHIGRDTDICGTVKNRDGSIRGCRSENKISVCYSTGDVRGTGIVGGIVGRIQKHDTVSNCYSTSSVCGSGDVGGIVGDFYYGGTLDSYPADAVCSRKYGNGTISGCAALNPEVKSTGKDVGRIVGYITITVEAGAILSNNLANVEMTNRAGKTEWPDKNANGKDGEDISASTMKAGGTIGGLFTESNGWIVQDGRLPSLFGETVEMPRCPWVEYDGEPFRREVPMPENGESSWGDEEEIARMEANGDIRRFWEYYDGDVSEELEVDEGW